VKLVEQMLAAKEKLAATTPVPTTDGMQKAHPSSPPPQNTRRGNYMTDADRNRIELQ
jgi:hypothetical protein